MEIWVFIQMTDIDGKQVVCNLNSYPVMEDKNEEEKKRNAQWLYDNTICIVMLCVNKS